MQISKQFFLSRSRSLLLCFIFLALQLPGTAQQFKGGRVLDKKLYHLGDDIVDLWPGISHEPEGEQLDVKFHAERNEKDFTITLTYWDVNYPAAVQVNGKTLPPLAPSQPRKNATLIIPAGTLISGENILTIVPQRTDDCVIGNIVLHEKPFSELMKLQTVTLSVTDEKSKQFIPARITIMDSKGAPAQIFNAPTNATAVRKGLIYIPGAETKIELIEDDYTFYATRGMEWSMGKQSISLDSGKSVKLKLRREVNTKGFISCDTHIHTLTFSGHGDSSAEERIITLAGEGVELAIATDHHHHTDYKPFQEKLGMNQYFTAVTGNEVSTKVGHFNTFPMDPNGPVPDRNETNWVKLVQEMRDLGGKVVILNHPRWGRFDAFAANGFNNVTGERASGVPITFDGMELVNSAAMVSNRMQLVEDWFAFLNYGENMRAIGASDSHNVGVVVGQGRTYIRSATDEPSKIDVNAACETILKGDISVSLGMFTDVVVNNRFTMGQIVPASGSKIKVKLRVAAPSWARPELAVVYLNGAPVAERQLSPKPGKPFNEYLTFSIPAPRHDAHLVCVVYGPGIAEPYWPIKEFTLAATNPVFLDADNDGKYQSPRATAKMILSKTKENLDSQWQQAIEAEDGVAIQLLDLIYKSANAEDKIRLSERIKKSNRKIFGDFLNNLPPETFTAAQ